MEKNLIFRKAEENDIEFISKVIIEAEKSGSDKISYCNIFTLSEDEFREILKNILLEDIEGCELSLSGFLIAEIDGEYAGACSSWVEGHDDIPSAIIKANLLFHFIPREKLVKAREIFKIIEPLNIVREKNTIQLESSHVAENFQGKGIGGMIMEELIKRHIQEDNKLKKVQIIMVKGNEKAYNAWNKIGFFIADEIFVDDNRIKDLLPSNNMVLLEREL